MTDAPRQENALLSKVLRAGVYKGFRWYIVSVGRRWACAYVDVTGTPYDQNAFVNKWLEIGLPRPPAQAAAEISGKAERELDQFVHGGITYVGGPTSALRRRREDEERWFVGWDYAHAGDYVPGLPGFNPGKKWAAAEIIADCERCIDEIDRLYPRRGNI